MALKFRVNSLDDVPEQFRPLYREDGGTYRLDAEGAVDKSTHDQFRSNNIALTNKISELEKKFEQYKDLDPEKARNALAELEKMQDQKLIDAGKVDELLAARTERMRADYEGRVEALTKKGDAAAKRAADLEDSLRKTRIDAEISKAVISTGAVKPGAMRDILARARETWYLDESGNLVPRDERGNTIFGPKAEVPLTTEEWAGWLMKESPYFFEGSSGGGATGGAGHGGGPSVVSRQQIATGQGFSLEDVASGKAVVQ